LRILLKECNHKKELAGAGSFFIAIITAKSILWLNKVMLIVQPETTAGGVQDSEPEPTTLILPAIEPIRFSCHAELQEYKDYLHNLKDSEVLLTARETHILSELTGFIVTRSAAVDHHSVGARIIGVNGRFISFALDDSSERFSLIPYVRINQ
jgi:hypothetical protein